MSQQGRAILGGDIAFSLANREADPSERAFLAAEGRVAVVTTLRAMARAADGEAALVELKAVDQAYPLAGSVELDPPGALADALAPVAGVYGAAAAPELLARLGVKVGSELFIGQTKLVLRALLQAEPDKLAVGVGFGPRLLLSTGALRSERILLPGSLVRWTYRLALPRRPLAGGGHCRGARRVFPMPALMFAPPRTRLRSSAATSNGSAIFSAWWG